MEQGSKHTTWNAEGKTQIKGRENDPHFVLFLLLTL